MHRGVKAEEADQEDEKEVSESGKSAVVPALAATTTSSNESPDQEGDGIDHVRKIGQRAFPYRGEAKEQGREQRSN